MAARSSVTSFTGLPSAVTMMSPVFKMPLEGESEDSAATLTTLGTLLPRWIRAAAIASFCELDIWIAAAASASLTDRPRRIHRVQRHHRLARVEPRRDHLEPVRQV